MNYYKYQFTVASEQAEMLLALISDLPYESFQDWENGIEAFVQEKEDARITTAALDRVQQFVAFEYKKTLIPYQNWNAVWESNFQAIQVDNFCGIRADFHPPFEHVQYELLINPKMAFGTGHHETTFLMMQQMSKLNFQGKKVLDYGCGTGILAILASMLGANPIDAVDIEAPSYHNTIENAQLNNIHNIEAILGTIDNISDADYDIILANINRHVILDSLDILFQKLHPKGDILFSGILKEDEALVLRSIKAAGFQLFEQHQKGNWLCLWVKK